LADEWQSASSSAASSLIEAKENFQREFLKRISKENFQREFPKRISKENFQREFIEIPIVDIEAPATNEFPIIAKAMPIGGAKPGHCPGYRAIAAEHSVASSQWRKRSIVAVDLEEDWRRRD